MRSNSKKSAVFSMTILVLIVNIGVISCKSKFNTAMTIMREAKETDDGDPSDGDPSDRDPSDTESEDPEDEEEVFFYLGSLEASILPLSLQSKVSTGSDGATITVTGLNTGTLVTLALKDDGNDMTGLACSNLPSWITLISGVMVVDFVSESETGTFTAKCSATNGTFRVNLSYTGSDEVLLTASTFGKSSAFSEASAPQVSADGEWLLFLAEPIEAEPFHKPLIAQKLDDGTWFVVSSLDGTLATSVSVSSYIISPDSSFVLFNSNDTSLGVTGGERQTFKKTLANPTQAPTMVSVTAAGVACNGDCDPVAISPDNTLVYFVSEATNMGANGSDDQIVRKNLGNLASAPQVVSVTAGGVIGNGSSSSILLSSDGSFGILTSSAANLGSNIWGQYIRKNLSNLATAPVAVSVTSNGTTLANNMSSYPSLAADDSFLLFRTIASNMGVTNAKYQIVKKNLLNLATAPQVVSVTSDGTTIADNSVDAPILSHDNSFVLFRTRATNIAGSAIGVDTYFKKSLTSLATAAQAVSVTEDGATLADAAYYAVVLNADDDYIYFTTEATNIGVDVRIGESHIYGKSLSTLTASVDTFIDFEQFEGTFSYSTGWESDVAVSKNDRWVAFTVETFPGLTFSDYQLAVIDLQNPTAMPRLVSVTADGVTPGDGASSCPAFDPTSRYVYFSTDAANLGATGGDRQYIRKDLQNLAAAPVVISTTNGTTLGDADSACNQGNDSYNYPPVVSPDGQWFFFTTVATNLGATSGHAQIVRKSLSNLTTAPQVVSVTTDGTTIGNGHSGAPVISSDGSFILFQSMAANLGSTTGYFQIIKKSLTNLATAPVVVSVASNGTTQANGSRRPRLSADDQTVFFMSSSENFGFPSIGDGHVVKKSLSNLATAPICLTMMGDGTTPATTASGMGSGIHNFDVSSDGSFIVYYSGAGSSWDGAQVDYRNISDLSTDPVYLSTSSWFMGTTTPPSFKLLGDDKWLIHAPGANSHIHPAVAPRSKGLVRDAIYKIRIP